MARLPFNPNDLPDRDVGRPARRERSRIGTDPSESAMTVTQVTLLVKDTLADHTPKPLRVVGEISNFSERGHWYLSLKDEENVLNVVMWKSAAGKVRFDPQRGMKVVATGRLDYYGPQARLQMYVDKLEPVGQGELELRFRQLCDQLREIGYFAPERKRPMPEFPQHIAVITSEKGAAVQDVIRTSRQRWPGIRISVIDVPVQGAGAAPKIADAIRAVDRNHEQLGIEAVVLTRGGGSFEDLWAFNEREVADAVFESTVPIAAAIGHEVDTTIAELVADLRCSTPTQAAERLVADARAERQHCDQILQRLRTALRRRTELGRSRWDAAARHAMFRRPTEMIRPSRERVGQLADAMQTQLRGRVQTGRHDVVELTGRFRELSPASRLAMASQNVTSMSRRLQSGVDRMLGDARSALKAAGRQLEAVGPKSVLERGYSYTTDARGNLVRQPTDVGPGDRVTTHLVTGQFDSDVVGTGQKGPAKRAARARKPKTSGDAQSSLFE